MLADSSKIGCILRTRRKGLRLSQRQMARLAGCSQPYICQVERGLKALSAKFSEILERKLELEAGCLSGLRVPRGRPPQSELVRWSRRKLFDTAVSPSEQRVRRSRHPLPVQPPVHRDPFWALGDIFGEGAAQELGQLEQVRGPDQLFWRRLTTTHFDSWPEKRFLVKLALDSLCLQSLQPAKLGCLLRVTDPKSGKWAAHRKRSALLSVRGELVVAAFPQLSVWTGAQYRRPDLTLVVARRDKRVTAALEVDGDLYHRDAAKEEARDRELGIPVYHLNANQTGDSKTLEHFYQWCETLVA